MGGGEGGAGARLVAPWAHGKAQSPSEHTSPVPQTRPQVPQLLASELRSTQPLAQKTRGAAHWQRLLVHVSSGAQARPQAPQCRVLVRRSTH